MNQLPEYKIRESTRAKHVSLKISPREGLIIVVPVGFKHHRIPAIIEKKQPWIDKTLQRVRPKGKAITLPNEIHFDAIGEDYSVSYISTDAPKLSYSEENNHLYLKGAIEQQQLCEEALKDWLRIKAKTYLTPWLKEVSEAISLEFKKVTIRNQRTRWGSCSRHKHISLNQKLLFLPKEVVRYLMIHELCHTKHLNHSKKFWKLVESKEPHYKIYDKSLRHAWQEYIPYWAE